MSTQNFNRIVIVGSSSSGKTTLARELSELLSQPHQELDFFNWGPNWTEVPKETFRKKVDDFTANEKWIIDGNYGRIQDLTIDRATTVIWLDYSLPLILSRFFRRSIRRTIYKEELWNANKETLKDSMWGKESLLMWILQVYKRNRIRYNDMVENDNQNKFVIMKSPKETNRFLLEISKA